MKEISFFIKDTPAGESVKKDSVIDHCSHKILSKTIVKDGYILPSQAWHGGIVDGGVVDSYGNYVDQSGYIEGNSIGYDFEKQEAKTDDECIYIGFFHICYGHAITDALKKLWYLRTDEAKELIRRGTKLVFITSLNQDLPSWHLRILELAGVDVSQLHQIRSITRYNRIIIPDNSIYYENNLKYWTKEFKFSIDTIRSSVKNSNVYLSTYPQNVYFTRTGINNKWRELGEKAIEKVFKKKGFAILSPETMTIDEQVAIIMKCNRFAATEGSVSHSAIFLNPSSEAIILRKADYANKNTTLISDIVGNKTTIIDVHHSIKAHPQFPMWGPFYLYVTKELKSYLSLGRHAFPYWLHTGYWRYIFRESRLGEIIRRIYTNILRKNR